MLQRASAGFVAGNFFDKYRSENPIHRHLMNGFLKSASELLQGIHATTILEAGAGPGDLAARILPAAGFEPAHYLGTDLCSEQVAMARVSHPEYRFEQASIYNLPAADASIDLVIACEVLEHVDEPERGLQELQRICRGTLLLSVPREPLWRVLNMARGKYLYALGNTPGHVQHFTPARLRCLCEKYFTVAQERRPLPWTMFRLTKKTV